MRSRRLHDTVWAGLLAALVTLPFADILLAGLNLYIRDIARGYYPQRQVLAAILRSGEIPFWNPFMSAGQPIAANPAYFAFYPLQWLLAARDYRDMFHLLVVAHYPIAAAGIYLLTRSLGVRPLVAWLAGFAYAIGSPMLSLSNVLPFLFAMAWLPWLGLFFRRFVLRGGLHNLALATLVLGTILLIGEVSMILQAGGLVALYAASSRLTRNDGRRRALGGAVAAVVVAILIAAVQLFPALEHKSDSGRAEALPYEAVMHWATHPARPLEAIWPTLFGSPGLASWTFWGGKRLLGNEDALPWLLHLYPGALVAIFALAGFLCRIRGYRFTLIVSGLSFLLALGPRGLLLPLLYRAGFSLVRYPEKFLLSAIFVITVFAAIAGDTAMRDPRVRKAAAIVAGVFAALTLAMFLATFRPVFLEGFVRVFDLSRPDAALTPLFRSGMSGSLVILTIALFLLADRRLLSPSVRYSMFALLLAIDLVPRVSSVMPRIAADYYTPPPAARLLMNDRPVPRIYSHANWQRLNEPNPPVPYGIRHWVLRNGILPESHLAWGIQGALEPDVSLVLLRPTIEFEALVDAFRLARRTDRLPLLMQMAGVTHMGVLQPLDPAVVADPRRYDEVDPVRFLPTRNAGRYYFASTIREDADVTAVFRILGSEEPVDPRTAFVALPRFDPAGGRVLSVSEGPNAIDLEVEAEGPALLVLAVTPHRYWSASVNGDDAILHRTNVGFQSLVLARGRHRVEMRYRNTAVVRFGIVSLLTGAAVLIVAIVSLLRRRKPADAHVDA